MKFTIVFSLLLNAVLIFTLFDIGRDIAMHQDYIVQLQEQSRLLNEENRLMYELNRIGEEKSNACAEYASDLFALLVQANESKPAIEPNHFLVFYDHSRGSGHATFQTNHGWPSSNQIYEHLYETAPCISNAILTGIVPLSEVAFLAWKPKESKDPCDPFETLPRLDWLRWDADTLIIELDSTKNN